MKFFISESMPEFLALLSNADYFERQALAKVEDGKRLTGIELQAIKDFNRSVFLARLENNRNKAA